MRFTEEDRKHLQTALAYLADSMIMINDIANMPTCNDCADKLKCQYCPQVGMPVRYNCPLWKGESEPARVLTLEEMVTEPGCVVCEFRYGIEPQRFTMSERLDFLKEGKTYGVTWRCWSNLPTDRQRVQTPWQSEKP